MNFTSDEEEQNRIAGNNDKTRDEEAKESNQSICDVAYSWERSVFLETSGKSTEDGRDSPASNMVKYLQALSFPITTNNHLIEVESNTESPQEIGQEEVMNTDRHDNANGRFGINPRFECDEERSET